MGGTCSTDGRKGNWIQYFCWKTGGERSLGRPRGGEEDNIRMDLIEIGWEDVDWMHLAEDRGQW